MKIKLTDADGYTRRGLSNETLWRVGETVRATGGGQELCTNGVLHYYDSVEVALFLDPIHANLGDTCRVWEVQGRRVAHDGTKGGAKTLTVVQEITGVQRPTTLQRVAFGILAAQAVPGQPVAWQAWADRWLSGEDRSRAAEAAWAAAWSAAWAAEAAWSAAARAGINLPKIARQAMSRTWEVEP